MTTHAPKERDGILRREHLLLQLEEALMENFLEEDVIKNYDDFVLNYASKSDSSKWISHRGADNISFFQFSSHDGSDLSKITISFKIYQDMSVSIHFVDNSLSMSRFQSILRADLKCSRFSIFDNLLSQLNDFEYHAIPSDDELSLLFQKIDEEMEDKRGLDFEKYCRLKRTDFVVRK